MVENRLVGIKSREVYEAPAAVCCTWRTANSRGWLIPRDLERLKFELGRVYADLVYNGLWFAPTREAIDAFVDRCRDASPARSASSVQGRRRSWPTFGPRALATRIGDVPTPATRSTTRGRGFIKHLGIAGGDVGQEERPAGSTADLGVHA